MEWTQVSTAEPQLSMGRVALVPYWPRLANSPELQVIQSRAGAVVHWKRRGRSSQIPLANTLIFVDLTIA